MPIIMKFTVMQFVKYCISFLVLEFTNHVKGQQYNLTGSSQYAVLEETFTWTCTMFIPAGQSVNGIKFYRDNVLSVGISNSNGKCVIESPNPRYEYGCVSDFVFTLTIPAKNMTEGEQKSKWRCEYVFSSLFRSPDVDLNIAIDVHNITLIPNENPLTLREGKKINVTCMVNSNAFPSPTFSWFIGPKDITSIAGTEETSIILVGNRTDNTNTLECKAKNNKRPAKTTNAILYVEYPPMVTILSQKFQIENTNLSVNCNTIPGNPNSTVFFWTMVDNKVFQQNGRNLLLPYVQRNSSGRYRCTANNTYRNGENGTDSGEIVINILYPPTVLTLSKQDIVENKTLSVTCNATDGNPSPTKFYWSKVENPEFRHDGATLQLNSIQRTLSGIYKCTAENTYGNGRNGTDSQSMVINVLYPPIVEAFSKENVIEGTDFSKNCNATPGNPNITFIFWTKREDPVFRQNGTTLQFLNIHRNRSGTYICTAENKYTKEEKGTNSQSMVVDVLYKPSIQHEPLQVVSENETVRLTRNISSNPSSDAFWYSKMESLNNQTNVTTASFTIKRATCTATKNYTLVARNIIGNDTSLVELIVNCKPKPNKYNITLGITDVTGVEFSTEVIAYPEPSYILENENGTEYNRMLTSIARNAINNFTIHFNQTNVKQSDYGIYFLKLSNSFGTATVQINLLPQKKPDEPRNINVECEVSGASVQWISSFNGGARQRFFVYAIDNQKTIISNSIPDTGENKVHTIYVQNLQPSVMYMFYVSAQNGHGNSSSESIFCTTLKQGDSLPLIVGGTAAAGVALAVIVIAIVLLRRHMQNEKSAKHIERLNNVIENEKDEADVDGLKENSLYVSAGPKDDEKTEVAVYAAVAKKQSQSDNNSNLYADVKKSGGKDKKTMSSDDKPKKGLFKKDEKAKHKKGKKPKNRPEETDVYENSEDIALSTNTENVYSNAGQKGPNKQKERGYKNKDGLLYVEVNFDGKQGHDNPVIHGEDEKTDYATVEFPMPSSVHKASGGEEL